MAKKKEVENKQTEFAISENTIIDRLVTVVSLPGDPYHKDGAEFQMAYATAKKLEKKERVKIKE